jgi:hypothetical protein
VRAGWVSDEVIKQLEEFVTGATSSTPAGAGQVLALPAAAALPPAQSSGGDAA